MRALELGKPLIRSTNNGLTAVTDHKGKIVEQVPQFETAVLRAELTPNRWENAISNRWYLAIVYLGWVKFSAGFRFKKKTELITA